MSALRFLFAHEYSATQAAFASAVTYFVIVGDHRTATILFFVGIVVSVIGELALEARGIVSEVSSVGGLK